MQKFVAISSAFALALAISAPASAQKDNNGRGGGQKEAEAGNDRSNGKSANSNARSKPDKSERRGNGQQGRKRSPEEADRFENKRGSQRQFDKRAGNRESRNDTRSDTRYDSKRGIRKDNGNRKDSNRDYKQSVDSERYIDRRFDFRDSDDVRRFIIRYDQDFIENRRSASWCPPGLRKKANGCLPPGQAKKLDRDDYRWGNYYRSSYSRFRDGDWRYYDGYAYQSRGGLIDALVPLVGGALFPGKIWPTAYSSYSVPDYYAGYYGRNDNSRYYYADRTVFSVDPEDQAILGIAGLLTGNDVQIGRPMPAGYDVYNVPYRYRGRYYDSPDAIYRYNDGYVYQIDPETRLVAAAIELIV